MKEITSLNDLVNNIAGGGSSWLLLFKKGSEQSDCALRNFMDTANNAGSGQFLFSDVNKVRDIHPEFGIDSVPALIKFRDGKMAGVVKGCQSSEQYKALVENSVFHANSGDNEKPAPQVTVYTTPTCSWCRTLKRHLDNKGIRYREVDVAANQKAAKEMVRKSGQQGVPQAEINGQMVVGFDQVRLNKLLGIN